MENEKRLHPLSWLFIIIEIVKQFFFPLIFALFAGGSDNYQLVTLIFIVPGVVFAIIQYWVYRYSLKEHEIVIREGVFVKNVRHVKYERIQNVNLSRNPLHRLFNVAQLELESASGGKPEAVMRVISLPAVEEIRQKVLSAKAAVQDSDSKDDLEKPSVNEDTERSILSLPLSELIKAGVISNKGMLVVAAVFGVAGQTGSLERFFDTMESRMNVWFDSVQIDFNNPVSIVVLSILGIVSFIILIRILSIAFMVVTYYGFELKKANDKLLAQYGLVTHFNATVPEQRIQLVSVEENMLHRYFARSAVRIATAGGNANQGGKSLKWIAPIINSDQLNKFVGAIQPDISTEVDSWQKVEFSGWKRITRVYIILLSIIVALLSIKIGWHSLWFITLSIFIVVYAQKTVASMRYGFSTNALFYESGWLVKRRTFVPISKIQSIELKQTPFDRRVGMASLLVDIAGLDLGRHSISIRFLKKSTANELMSKLYTNVSNTVYRWK
ncbi:PH domain-containing protein [Pleionea sediminis]|uniref:PH domain-containing protein n=1 Tax=Pleionea sediminis TaxID=2569479 RepID=UPI001185D46D|nr:PH domain-containing protein [Pleionea sediminis]